MRDTKKARGLSPKQKRDQADAVVRVNLPKGDLEACKEAVERGYGEAVEALDRVNALRKGKFKVGPRAEITTLDSAGNKMLVVYVGPGETRQPKFSWEKCIDTSGLPNFSYLVATDEDGQRIVVRIEYESTSLQ